MILTKKESEPKIHRLENQYEKKLKKLFGESVVRFKGSWDIDLYAKETIHRNKMAHQARTLFGEDSKETN